MLLLQIDGPPRIGVTVTYGVSASKLHASSGDKNSMFFRKAQETVVDFDPCHFSYAI